MTRRFVMTIWASALLCVAATADVKMTADIKDGDKVAGVRHITVNVDSKNLVTSVEFYVNGDLRSTDDSTPYEFDLDGITEAEGPITLKIAAFTNEGEKAEQTLKLNIDNNLGRGAGAFVDLAKSALTAGNLNDAITNGRLALKADSKSNAARLILAQTYYKKNTFDEAQKYSEDIVASEPRNVGALDLLSAIQLKKTFSIMSRSGTRADQIDQMKQSLVSAVSRRAKVYQIKLDDFGAVTDANLIAYCDLAIRAGRYSLVTERLSSVFRRDFKNSAVANRLAYAYMRNGRMDLAASVLADHVKRTKPDAVGSILAAISAEYQGSPSDARNFENMATSGAATLSGQSFLALVRNQPKSLATSSASLIDQFPQSPVANYYRAIALSGKDFTGSRDSFETAVLAEPAGYDFWLQRANESISSSLINGISKIDQGFSRDMAEAFLDVALAARPDSFEALTSHAILSVYKGAPDEAYRWAKAAVAAGPGYGAAHYALALTASLQNKKALDRVTQTQLAARNAPSSEAAKYQKAIADARAEARRYSTETETAMKNAQKLDPTNLGGRSIPDALTAWNHINRYGRTPLLDWGR